MPTFCTDVDLLHWEPGIFVDAAFASQTLMNGSGNLDGTAFTIADGSFLASHIAAEQVILFNGSMTGSFPIIRVDSATALTVSVLYDGLAPADGAPLEPSPPGTVPNLPFTVRSFWAQRQVVSDLLRQAIGIVPGSQDQQSLTILNPKALQRPCALGTLQMIYSALAAASSDKTSELSLRADLYERLYKRALRSVCVEMDTDGDGRADCMRRPGLMEFVRA